MLTGIDTGFFYELFNGNLAAAKIWQSNRLISSVLVVHELQKKILKGEFAAWPALISDIEKAVNFLPVTLDIAKKASHIAYGTGIPSVDSLILSTLLEAGCKEIYSKDSHFSLFKKKGINIIIFPSTIHPHVKR
jgi:predicted nucleic acid-binding protein